MVRRRNMRNNNNRFRGRRIRRNQRKNTLLNGTTRQAPVNPKATVLTPWNTVTLQRMIAITNDTNFTITLGYVREALLSQLNIGTFTGTFNFRFLRATFYDMSGRPFHIKLLDTSIPTNSSVNTEICADGVTYPGRAGWSRASLQWPKVISANPVSVGTTNNLPIVSGSVGSPLGNTATGTSFLMQLRLLWRFPGGAVAAKDTATVKIGPNKAFLPFESKDTASKPAPAPPKTVQSRINEAVEDDDMIDSFDTLDVNGSEHGYPSRRQSHVVYHRV